MNVRARDRARTLLAPSAFRLMHDAARCRRSLLLKLHVMPFAARAPHIRFRHRPALPPEDSQT